MTSLELKLLGGFQVQLSSGLTFAPPTRKSRALLAYLALHPDKAQSREELVAVLWSERAERQGRNSLSQAITALRKGLAATTPSPLVIEVDSLTFDSAKTKVDALTFEQLVSSGTPQDFERAEALYQGDLLAGIGVRDPVFEEWLVFEQGRLRGLAVGALTALLSYRVEQGQDDLLIATAQRLLKIDPLQEAAHRALMRCYAEQGQAGLALRQYQACAEVLKRELDVEPDEETVQLYHDVVRRRSTRVGDLLPDKPSIAVLAFDNLSGDPDQEYFADGIAEDIITALSKFRWFFVIARNSSFTYKGKSVDVKQVARELGVRYVLEGSVRKAGSRVRISAQLIDGQTGNHVWAVRYDRELADIFELQDEMTATIVGAIEPELGAAERDRAKRKPPDNLDAWDRYQQGLWHLWRYTREDADEAEKLFQSAIDLDPGFGPAYAGVGYLHYYQLFLGWTDAPDQTLGRALRAGQQAVSLDDKDAVAHFVLGRVHMMQGDFEAAIAETEKAIDLNPNFAIAYCGLGLALNWSGRAREALPHLHRAIRQSPHDPALWLFETIAGYAHIQLGEYAAAVEWLRKAARHPNSSFMPNLYLSVAFVEQEESGKARAAMDAALQLQPNLSLTAVAAMFRPMSDLKDRFLDSLRKAGLPD